MGNAETLTEVVKQLRELFLEKPKLKGYDDWDRFFGCINAIQQVAQNLTEEEPEEADMVAEE